MPSDVGLSGWSPYQSFLAVMMVVTGSINTLSTKWADESKAEGANGETRKFVHPFLQASGMFIGEFFCLLTFHMLRCWRNRRNEPMELGDQSFNRFLFLPAALLDMTGTSLMYLGLNLTFASSFQMLRGAVIVFTALLSVAFLGRRIHCYMWLGIGVVIMGLIMVGLSDIFFRNGDSGMGINSQITGDELIIMAQVIVALQMVYEEKVLTRYNVPPLQAVGLEGMFGFLVLGTLLVPMYFIKVGRPFSQDPDGRLENTYDAFVQMGNNWQIIVATIGNISSIALFNFAGISVTAELSATTRMVLDSLRTLVIWAVSLSLRWQPFAWNSFLMQAGGFFLLVVGMCLYNDLVCRPVLIKRGCISGDEGDQEFVDQSRNIDDEENYHEQSPLLKD